MGSITRYTVGNCISRAILGVVCLVVVAGCAGGGGIPRGSEMYPKSRLAQFDRDTGPDPSPAQYLINYGDRLDVVFLYHANLTTRDLLVRPDGRISLPYVGDVNAFGITPMALDTTLTTRFSEILRDPTLSVIVKEARDKRIYVLGDVKSPGAYTFDQSMSLIQAFAEAGGVIRGAKPEHTVVIRRRGEESIVGVEVNVKDIMGGKAIGNDIWLQDLDIIYVPRSRIQSVADFAQTFGTIINVPIDAAFTYWQIRNLQENFEFFQNRNSEDASN